MNESNRAARVFGGAIVAAGVVGSYPGIAFAHAVHNSMVGGVVSGVVHPLAGLDHLLALLAVGLWAGMRGEGGVWQAGVAFVAAMAAGVLVHTGGFVLPVVAPMFLASMLVLGLLATTGFRMPKSAALVMLAVFGLLNGHAHGSEALVAAAPLAWFAGLIAASALVIAAGSGLSVWLRGAGYAVATRGTTAAVAGAALLLGAQF